MIFEKFSVRFFHDFLENYEIFSSNFSLSIFELTINKVVN